MAADGAARPSPQEAPARALVDGDARREAVESRERVLVVEAGAGSGKTSVLVERIVSLVSSGDAELRQVAAITFTEAAASELRERVRHALRARAGDGPAGGPLERALGQVDEAVMGTIHSFCRRILVDHALEAGLPPGFEVLDEVAYELDTERRLAAFFEELAEDDAAAEWLALAKALAPGIGPADLEAVVRGLDGTFGREPETPALSSPPRAHDPSSAVVGVAAVEKQVAERAESSFRSLLDALREACATARACEVAGGDALLARLRRIEPVADQLRRASRWSRRLRLLSRLPSLRARSLGNAKNWPKEALAEVRARLAEAEESRAALVQAIGEEVAQALLLRCRRFVADAANGRRDEGCLGFDDLLVWTRALLQLAPAVRDAVAARYPYLFIDELQDTDPLQLEIAALLAGAGPVGADGAAAPSMPRAHLFVVGDPKQSIYRFRGADLRAYEEIRRRLAVSGPLSLRSNFRSRPEVLEFVNAAFGELLRPYAVDLEAARPASEHPAFPAVWRLGDTLEEGTKLVEVREREAEDVAVALERLLGRSGGPPVETWDRDERRLRRLLPADVAILVPRRTGVRALAEALARHEIPYRLDSAALFLGEEEVRSVLWLARALEDPGDDVALLAALRSPVLACDDASLAEFAAAGGRWSLDAEVPPTLPEDHRVVRALARLRELHRRRRVSDPVHVLVSLVESPEVAVLAARDERAAERFARLDYLLAEARAFFGAGGTSLTSFAAWFERKSRVELPTVRDEQPAALGGAGEEAGAVQVLTVHAAKGLEFAAVVLAGFGTIGRRQPAVVRVLAPRHGAGGIGLRLRKGLETAGFAELDDLEGEELRAEQRRLLYVAATRARDYLLVCAHRLPAPAGARDKGAPGDELGDDPLGEAPVLAEMLAAAERGGVVLEDLLTAVAPQESAPSPEGASGEALGPSSDAVASVAGESAPSPAYGGAPGGGPLARWRAERMALVGRSRVPRTVAVAELLDEETGRAPLESSEEARFGRAVHAVLEQVELVPPLRGEKAPRGLAELAEREAARRGLAGRGAEVARLARSVLGAEVVERAAAAARRWRELPVTALVELSGEAGWGEEASGGPLEVGVEGIVDLCFEEEGELVVVEYKIRRGDTSAAGSTRRLRRRDRLQGGLYALLLAAASSRPVGEVVFVVASHDAFAEQLVLEDLDGARDDALRLLRKRLRP